MFMSICSIDNEFTVWHLWLDNNAKSVTNIKVSHLRVISSQLGKDFRISITISASYMQIYRGSAGLVLKIPFNILVIIGCLPNSILSFTGRMFDSVLLAVLIAEYPSLFLYKNTKNSVPSLIDAFDEFCKIWSIVWSISCTVFLYLMPWNARLAFQLQYLNDFCSID